MQINFNGKTYNSLEEMPGNERQAYEQLQKIFVDANGNGIPDFLEGDVAQKVVTAFTSVVNHDGKIYNNLDELPPEMRQKVKDAFAKLNEMGILNPSMTDRDSSKSPAFDFAFQPSTPMIPKDPAIEESNERSRKLVVILAILIALIACGMGAVFFLLAR